MVANIIGSNVTGNDDLQSAGVQAPDPSANQPQPNFQQDAGSLLRALSQGPMQQAQANPDMANWAGLAGWGFGGMGQANPGMNQLLAAQEADRRQKMATFEVMDAVQRRRRQQAQDQIKIYEALANSDDPNAKKMGWQGISKVSGIELPPPVLEGLTTGKLTTEKMNQVAARVLSGWDDATIMKYTPGITMEMIAPLRQYAQSDAAKKALKIETGPEMENRVLKEDLLRTRAALDEVKSAEAIRKGDLAERTQTAREAQNAATNAAMDRRLGIMEQDAATRARQADIHAKEVAGKLEALGKNITTKEQKRTETMNVMEDAINMMETHAAALDKKGYLPKGTDILSAGKAQMNRKLFPGDSDWAAWKQLQASLIGFDRTVLNDIGARAFSAFKNQFEMFDNPPPKAAIDKTIANMRALLKTAKEGKMPPTERVTIRLPDGRIQQADDYRPGDALPPGAQIIKAE